MPPPPLTDHRAFSAVFDHATEGIFLADDDAHYLRVNPAGEGLTGYSVEELRALTVFDLTPEADREQGLAMWREFIRKGTLSGDYALTRKDGTVVEVAFEAVANIMPGIHLSVMRDVTARTRHRRRSEQLLEASAAMSAAASTEEVANVILEAGLKLLGARSGHVLALVDDGRWMELVARIGMPDPEPWWNAAAEARGQTPRLVDGRPRYALDSVGVLESIFRSGESIHVTDVEEIDPEGSFPELRDLGHTCACLPLVVSGKLVGGLYLFWDEDRVPNESDRALAATLAGLCGQALARARLFTAEHEARQRAVESEEKLKSMAFDHVLREEAERRHLAITLHDGLGQHLALAKMALNPLRQKATGADRTALDSAIDLIDKSIDETRSISFELSPPILYDLGIASALCWLAEKLEAEVGLRVEVIHGGVEPPVDEVTASIAFRAVRELLINVVKHTSGMKAKVTIRPSTSVLEIVVDDEGDGFDPSDPSTAGFGLMSIRQEIGRLGGTVAITSSVAGTRAAIRVPMRPKPPNGV